MTTETPKSNPLEDALVAVIKKTTNAVEAGADFLAAQLPEVIQQLLMWHAVKSFIWFALFIAAFLLVLVIVYKGKAEIAAAKGASEKNDLECARFWIALFSLAPLACAMQNLEWLQILIAPKVYLIEYAASLVR